MQEGSLDVLKKFRLRHDTKFRLRHDTKFKPLSFKPRSINNNPNLQEEIDARNPAREVQEIEASSCHTDSPNRSIHRQTQLKSPSTDTSEDTFPKTNTNEEGSETAEITTDSKS